MIQKKILTVLILFVHIQNIFSQVPCKEMYFQLPEGIKKSEYIENKVIFKIKSLNSISQINLLFANSGDIEIKKMFPNKYPLKEKTNIRRESLVDLSLIYELNFNPQTHNISCVINKLYQSQLIEYAEPYYIPELSFIPNDSLIFNFTQYDAQIIQAYDAWNISWGDTNVVIGIVDTGTDTNHVELKGNLQFNENDPINGIDDDGDGYIDNYFGWNSGSNNFDAQANTSYHGLHVTGISSALTHNSIGRAGIGFRSRYIPVKATDSQGRLTGAYQGIVYAADMNCDIINCSWGSNNKSQFAEDIVNYATFNKDALIIGGAGNNSNIIPFYPAAYLNALGVAATGSSDLKWEGSNYGNFIDIAAPGEDIVSCWVNNGFSNSSGTSMAAPVVAGVAATIKAQFPHYSALQLKAQLIETADNINATNPNYIDQLGAGRVNMFNAITDTVNLGVLMIDYQISDLDDEAYVENDTIHIGINIKNYLEGIGSMQVTLTSLNGLTTVIDGNKNFPALNTFDEANNFLDAFKVVVNENEEKNLLEEFKITLLSGNYSKTFYIQVQVNVDFLNINTGKILTTMASNGRIGFPRESGRAGVGFIYNDSIPLLYEAGIMFGNSNFRVSSNVRGSGGIDQDISSFVDVNRPWVFNEFDDYIHGYFTDFYSGFPFGFEIRQEGLSWNQSPNNKYMVFNYMIKNNSQQNFDNFYFGIFADWDIGDYSKNKASFDVSRNLAYVWNTENEKTYAGVQFLKSTRNTNVYHYAIDNINAGFDGIDATIGFLKADKFTTLSTNRPNAGQGADGNDVMHVVSSGPYNIAAYDSVMITFAFLVGDSLSDLQNIADAAISKINSNIPLNKEKTESNDNILIYPNPFKENLRINLNNINFSEIQLIEIYDLQGRVIWSSENINENDYLISTKNWNNGVYLIKVAVNDKLIVKKIVKN